MNSRFLPSIALICLSCPAFAQDKAAPSQPPQTFQTVPEVDPAKEALRMEERQASRRAVIERIEPILLEGQLSEKSGSLFADSKFTIGYGLPPKYRYVTEAEGHGWQAGNEQMAWLANAVGNPISVDCELDAPKIDKGHKWHSEICKIATDRPGHGLSARVLFEGDKVTWVQFYYFNPKIRDMGEEALAAEDGV